MNVILIIIGIAIYLASAWYCIRWTKIAHSEVGRWSGLNIEVMDVLLSCLPVMNTFYVFINLFNSPYSNAKHHDFNS
jgi:hypothetical protein